MEHTKSEVPIDLFCLEIYGLIHKHKLSMSEARARLRQSADTLKDECPSEQAQEAWERKCKQ